MNQTWVDEKKKLTPLLCKRGCSFSRVFCCTSDKCNTDHAKETQPYEDLLYDEWQGGVCFLVLKYQNCPSDKLEEAIRTRREAIYNSTSGCLLSKLKPHILLALALLIKI